MSGISPLKKKVSLVSLIFNCSFGYQSRNLNEYLLPGPVLGPSLIGILFHFRQHHYAVSGEFKSMFNQAWLLTKPLLSFLWRDVKKDKPAGILSGRSYPSVLLAASVVLYMPYSVMWRVYSGVIGTSFSPSSSSSTVCRQLFTKPPLRSWDQNPPEPQTLSSGWRWVWGPIVFQYFTPRIPVSFF